MEIHHEAMPDVNRYLDNHRHLKLEDFDAQYQGYLRAVGKYKKLDASTRILEIGTGVGWFPIRCEQKGWHCLGLEISPQLIEYAKQFGAQYGVEPNIELGNIEDRDLGENQWDVVIASNVFEHVEFWRPGIAKLYRSLAPGGVMFFESTNKFSFSSGEYDKVPLYGWFPNQARYWIRRQAQGPEIMKLGIDFNQFRHGQLRAEFKKAGFSRIYDRVDMTEESWVSTDFRKKVVRMSKQNALLKAAALTFSDATRFICVK